MSVYQALYRKYRPQTFDDVVGQTAVTQTLKTQLVKNQLSHAYLFTGSRGTGKTSCAKILAKAVNCLAPHDGNPCNCCEACRAIDSGACMDVLEIDAASNNGVDNVRDLRDDAVYTPSQVKKRVYIIDEVHMLSISAFNALLKIIEEPPEHLLFILATTELHKVPATILSRCQRFSFRRIGAENIAARLQFVAYQENIDLDPSAARVLSSMADGAMRDALSLLDQCASATAGELTAQRVYECLGIAGERTAAQMLGYIAAHDTAQTLQLFDRIYADGKDVAALLDELICLCRDVLVLKTAPQAGLTMLTGVADEADAASLARTVSTGELMRYMNLLQTTLASFTRADSCRTDAELCLLNMCRNELSLDAASLNARLTRLEEQLRSGVVAVATQQEAPAAPQTASAPVSQAEETPDAPAPQPETPQPVGFWSDLVAAVRRELKPPTSGFFAATPNAPIRGILRGDVVWLQCVNRFALEMVDKPEVLELVAAKAGAILGRRVTAKAADENALAADNGKMEQLLSFGKAHDDVIHIKS